MIKKGIYETVSGEVAVVAQLRSVNCTNWIVRGAILVGENVFCIAQWTSEGKSFHAPHLNLIPREPFDKVRAGQTS